MRVRTFFLIPLLGIVALVLLAAPAGAQSQGGSFSIGQNGKPVGTASFKVSPAPAGFDSTSTVRVDMQGLNYALSKTEQLSSTGSLVHVQVSATVNGSAVNVIAKPDGAQILMNTSANGRSSTTQLAAHKLAVLLPDFDPGAIETLLTMAAKNNGRDLWAIIPKQAGSIQPIQLATYRDEQGTLNGTAITVHHIVATIAGAETDLFSGPENQLHQAELPQNGFALIRNGFVLKPPTKAPAAPPATASDQSPTAK
jgi:hypothetical protein